LDSETEEYLGGISSTDIIVKAFPGNGVHATSKRLILVRSGLGSSLGGNLFGMAGRLGGTRTGRLSGRAAVSKIGELEKKMYFEIKKEEVASLELMRHEGGRICTLRIIPKSGEAVDVSVIATRDFEAVKDLVNAFCPEAVTNARN